jgi:uncharacterized membrane protein YfcA
MDFLTLLFLGSTVGFVSAFFGIGGGSIIVPVLYMLYPKLPITIVIPISLGTIFLASGLNSIRFYKAKAFTDKKIILLFVLTCSIGSISGAFLTNSINTELGKKILACVLILSVFKILFYKAPDNLNQREKKIDGTKISLTGLLGSFISSITGLGGGIIFTPMLISVVKLPIKIVSPYSNLAMLVATFGGVFPHLFKTIHNPKVVLYLPKLVQNMFIGTVNYGIILIIFTTVFIGSKVGIHFNNKVEASLKKKLLAFVILTLILKLLLS